MNIDEKYLWPIIGVIIGWLLNVVSNYSKYRIELKMHSGKALTYLIIICDQVTLLNKSLDKWKDNVDSWEEFEKMREYSMKRYLLASEKMAENIDNAFKELSGIHPLYARKLLGIKDMLLFHKSISLTETVKIKPLYIKVLSAFEAAMEITAKELKKEVLRLSFKHGIITWIKMKYSFSKRRKSGLEAQFINDLFADFADAKSKTEK
jgi:hypothetical protein